MCTLESADIRIALVTDEMWIFGGMSFWPWPLPQMCFVLRAVLRPCVELPHEEVPQATARFRKRYVEGERKGAAHGIWVWKGSSPAL